MPCGLPMMNFEVDKQTHKMRNVLPVVYDAFQQLWNKYYIGIFNIMYIIRANLDMKVGDVILKEYIYIYRLSILLPH